MKTLITVFTILISSFVFCQVTEYYGTEKQRTYEKMSIVIKIDKTLNMIFINTYYSDNEIPDVKKYNIIEDQGKDFMGYYTYKVRDVQLTNTIYTLYVKSGAYSLFNKYFNIFYDYRGEIDFEIKE